MDLVYFEVSLNSARQIKMETNIMLNIRQQLFTFVYDGFIRYKCHT